MLVGKIGVVGKVALDGSPGRRSWYVPTTSHGPEIRGGAASGGPSPSLRFLFPVIFNRFQLPGIGVLPDPMLPSNRRYADTTRIPRPLRLPRLPGHSPTRRRRHHRRRAEDRPVCVTKFPAIPATPSRKWAYLRTRNTLNFRNLRHNSPSTGPPSSRRRLGRLPQFAQAPQSSIFSLKDEPGGERSAPRR
jgi:hypothetical protein